MSFWDYVRNKAQKTKNFVNRANPQVGNFNWNKQVMNPVNSFVSKKVNQNITQPTRNFVNSSPKLNWVDNASNFIKSDKKVAAPVWDIGDAPYNRKIVPGAYNLIARPFINGALDISLNSGLDIGRTLVDPSQQFNQLKSPITKQAWQGANKLNPNAMRGMGVNSSTGEVLGNTGQIIMDIADVYMPGAGKKVLAPLIKRDLATYGYKQLLKQAIKTGVIQGGKEGAKVGGAYAFGEGLNENRNENLDNQLGNAMQAGIIGGAGGAIVGGAIGGLTPVVTRGGKVVYKTVKGGLKAYQMASPAEKQGGFIDIGATTNLPESPVNVAGKVKNTQKSGQQLVVENTPQTNPSSQTPTITNQAGSFDNNIPQAGTRVNDVIQTAIPGVERKVPIISSGGSKDIKVKINALGDVSPETIKDISGIDATFKSVYRNFEKAFGNKFEAVKRRILDPFDVSKGNMVREQAELASNLQETIVKKLGIKKGSKESALVQQFGEGRLTLDDLKAQTKNWKNIVEADKWFRTQYDQLLDGVNTVRGQIYPNNPDKIIPRRKDYYRHFQELTGFEGLKNLFDSPANIPTELAGVSDNTKPKSKFLSFAQKRLGLQTKDDAVGGFINYMRSATYAKNIDPHISKFRGLADELSTMAEQGDDKTLGSRFAEYLRDFSDDLSGKTNFVDRAAQKIFTRRGFALINWLNSRVKANVILGNLSSSVAQAGNTPQMMAKAGYRNWAGGFKDLLSRNNNVIDSSNFIKERYSTSLFDQFDTKILDQPKKLAVWLSQSMDELATKIGWNGFYRQAIEKGVANPVKYADDLTRSMVGGRGVGEVPLFHKSKAMQLVAPFQLEVQNLMQVLGKEVADKEIGVILKYMVAAYGFNKAAETIRGNGVTFDPIQAVTDAIKTYQEEEDKGIGAMRAGGRIAGEVLSNTIGGQQIASLYPEYGVKVGGETVTRKELFGDKDPTRFGQGLIANATQNPLYKVLPPFGGSQLEKTIKGGLSYAQGYVKDKAGNVQYEVDKNPINLAKSLAFGKYATSNAKEFFDKGRDSLGEKQSELYKVGAKTYDEVMSEREQEKELKKLKDGKKSNKAEDLGNGLFKVGEKFYSKDLDREFKTREEAELEVEKDKFDKSGKRFLIDQKTRTVFTKDSRGKVKDQSIEEYYEPIIKSEFSRLVDEYKRNDDINSYLQLNDSYTQYLQQRLNTLDPDADRAEIIKLQNTIADNKYYGSKYASQGGFKKAKKPKRLKAPKAPSVSVARTKSPKIKTIKAKKPAKIKIKSL